MADELIQSLIDDGSISADEGAIQDADLRLTDAEGNTQGSWIDADTVRLPSGNTVRLSSYDAREINKFVKDKETGELTNKEGEVGGSQQMLSISKLARDHGFNNLVDTGNKGSFGRPIYDLQNAAGTTFGDYLTETGVVEDNKYSSQQALDNQAFQKLWATTKEARGQQAGDWDVAADWVQEFIASEGPEQLKKIAHDESELAAARNAGVSKHYIQNDVEIKSYDRSYLNKAKNPLSTSWDTGWKGVEEGAAGLLELVGHETGWEGLEDYAEGWKNETQYELQNLPTVITDYTEFMDDDSWHKNTGEFFEYVGNMAAMSLPYMAITIGGVAVGGTVGLAAPAAVYAGQVWNEMGDTDESEKNAVLALGAGISMAALDRLGVRGIANASALSREGREQIIGQLVGKGMSRDQAKNAIMKATKLEAAKLAGDASKFAKEQITKRRILKDLIKSGGIAAGSEGLTEVGQETVAYLAAVAGSNTKEFDADELIERLTHAAVGGSLLGAGFSIPGTAYNTGQWTDVAYRLAPADERLRTQQNQWAAEEREAHGRVLSHDEILQESERKANTKAAKGRQDTQLADRAARDEKRRGDRSWGDWRQEAFESIPGLWRGATRHIFNDKLQERSRSARQLASLFSGQLSQMYSGSTFENAKHLQLAEYKNHLDLPAQTAADFGFNSPSIGNLSKMSDIIYDAYNRVGTDFDKLKGSDLEKHIPALKKFNESSARMADKIWADQKEYNPELGYTKDYAYKRKSLDKSKIASNKQGFEKDLQERFGLDSFQAAELTRQILNVESITDIDEAFSVTEKGGLKPTSHKNRSLGLSEDPEFSKAWLNNNIMTNLSDMAKGGARYTSYQKYLGDDNRRVTSLIGDMEAELVASGMDPKEAQKLTDKAARGMQDYIDAESGNYKRPQTKFGESLQDIQRNFLFVTTISSLPLATLSSIVELALSTRSLNQQQIGNLAKMAKKEVKAIRGNMNWDRTADTAGRKQLKDLGFFEWEVGAATVTGATESFQSSQLKQRWTDNFFRAIGLKQWTDLTRAIRASVAGDYMMDKLAVVAKRDLDNLTNEEVEAEDALRQIGINVEDAIEIFNKTEPTEADQQTMEKMFRDATFNFINDAVVLPQAALRPLFYQDPRFALFTQFHGFISTFQANHLPKLYRSAFKGQTPAIKYNAFATIATMVLLGFLSQYLKDLLKYGEDARASEVAGQLEQGQWIQRGINSSGLLGVGERALNAIHPIYESRTESTPEWLFDAVVGESAAASKAGQLLGGAEDVLSGDTAKGVSNLAKATPLGPFTRIRKESANFLFEE